MSRPSRRLVRYGALALLAALVAGLVVALVRQPERGRVDLGGQALVVRPALTPRDPQFGDTVTAAVDVFADPGKLDTASIQVRTRFRPYVPVSSTRSVEHTGGAVVLHLSSRIRCLTLPCVPREKVQAFSFPPVRVSYREGSVTRVASSAWPALHVHSRVTAAEVARPVLRVPPPVAAEPSYRVSPDLAGYGLLALAALLAAGGAALLLRVALTHADRSKPRVPPLERVLVELAASCSNGDSGRRRRALEDLARELEPIDEPLSKESRVLAWGPREPQPDAISDLSDRVRTVVRR